MGAEAIYSQCQIRALAIPLPIKISLRFQLPCPTQPREEPILDEITYRSSKALVKISHNRKTENFIQLVHGQTLGSLQNHHVSHARSKLLSYELTDLQKLTLANSIAQTKKIVITPNYASIIEFLTNNLINSYSKKKKFRCQCNEKSTIIITNPVKLPKNH